MSSGDFQPLACAISLARSPSGAQGSSSATASSGAPSRPFAMISPTDCVRFGWSLGSAGASVSTVGVSVSAMSLLRGLHQHPRRAHRLLGGLEHLDLARGPGQHVLHAGHELALLAHVLERRVAVEHEANERLLADLKLAHQKFPAEAALERRERRDLIPVDGAPPSHASRPEGA